MLQFTIPFRQLAMCTLSTCPDPHQESNSLRALVRATEKCTIVRVDTFFLVWNTRAGNQIKEEADSLRKTHPSVPTDHG